MPRILYQKGVSGNPKGRPKGIVNAKTICYNIAATMEEMGFDPVRAMIEIAMNEKIDMAVRKSATKDLLDKVVPTIKSIEHKGDAANNYALNILLSTPEALKIINDRA